MKIPALNLSALKNASIDTVSLAAGLITLEFLDRSLLTEAIVSGCLCVALTIIKYHYFPSAPTPKNE